MRRQGDVRGTGSPPKSLLLWALAGVSSMLGLSYPEDPQDNGVAGGFPPVHSKELFSRVV